ncbi:MAG: chemotaxis protein CheA, partial [Hungatella sp.]
MDNGMDNMLDMYLFETNSLLDQLDELLIDAEKVSDFSIDNVNEIFRIMHTIKGSSAMMEFSSLMTIAHQIEDLFFYIRENGIEQLNDSCKRDLFDLMFRSNDYLRAEVGKVENNQPLTTNIDNFISEINTFLDKIRSGGVSATSTANAVLVENAAVPSGINTKHAIRIYFDDNAEMENLRAFMLVNSLREAELSFTFIPADVETREDSKTDIIENGFVLIFESSVDADSAISIIQANGNIRSYEFLEEPEEKQSEDAVSTVSADTTDVSPTAPDSGSATPKAATAAAPNHGVATKQSLISVNLSKLDSLMAIVGEIVITESMVTSSPELRDLKLDSFLKSSRQLRSLTEELQDIAMSLRMVSVSGVFQKMNRIVRDMNQQLGKDVKLTIVGENTEVDKTIVDNIGDPIMHIVRNSMDHGIEENAEKRIAAGKSPQGNITLSASHTGSEVVISVVDDGRGMDTDAILAKASRNGILNKPEGEYSKREILNLLLLPGFSTNEQVTEFSGRGVGMDVVKKNVESVGGIITITSDMGKGSCVTLKIPLTLAIVDGMEISVGHSIFTIPIANIRQTFKVSPLDIIHGSDGDEIIERMGIFYPIIRLHKLYN